jgi:hypothetical protein
VPQFYFDFDDSIVAISDKDGQDLPALEAVRKEAHRLLSGMPSGLTTKDGGKQDLNVDVWDATGEFVYTATLSWPGQPPVQETTPSASLAKP